ncbi:MAG TPA: NADP-dependent glyceraldehyde-3-phosphate dehydrogenase [Spirochaetota bacterium]|nr:NADP-dependent glyceraldehyde-3-phosphate dehydrogenase [Spirochaetota bacterium]
MNLQESIKNIFPDEKGVPAEFRLPFPIIQKEYLVNGEIRTWNGGMQDVLSPVCLDTGRGPEQMLIGQYPMLTEKEALEALEAATAAYDNGKGEWPAMPVAERIKRIEKLAFLMKEKRSEIISLLMWEIGKSFNDSGKEFDRTIEYMADTINALKDLDRAGSRFDIKEGIIGQVRRAPLGVVLCMGPFNYPLNETFATLVPALIMGNTIIFKPPKIGVLLHRPLLQAFRDALPKGVVNTVYGDGARVISPMMASGKVNVLAFIGSSRVADLIKKQHPKPHRLRSVLGLDAKNAGIILKDADIPQTVKECVLGSLSFNGQRCTALKILFVHRDIADEFLKQFGAAVSALKPGMPWDKDVMLTPLPETNKTQYMTDYIEDAKKNGAKVVNDGGAVVNNTFMFPAVLYPVNDKMKIYNEEQFGPVVPVVSFSDIDEPINYVVDSNFGQQVSIFGRDSGTIAKLLDIMVNQVCRVNINTQCQRGPDSFPFTGRKDSAEGTLSVTDALRVFTIRTLVAVKGTDTNKQIITEILEDKKSNFLSTDFIF